MNDIHISTTAPIAEESNSSDLPNSISSEGSASPCQVQGFEELKRELAGLREDFQTKLQYDAHKEKIIDRMHIELQAYKSDLVQKLLQPVILDIIHTLDDMQRVVEVHKNNTAAEFTREKSVKIISSFVEDLQHLLYRQGVESFVTQSTLFDPKRQQALKRIETSDLSLDKNVALVMRDGYDWNGKMLRPQSVNVYVYNSVLADGSLIENKAESNPEFSSN